MPDADVAPLKNKTRVRVTEAMRGVPEGTSGTVRGTVGLAFPRHRVAFDNGHFVTSVARMNLVLEGEWDEFQADKAAKAEAAAKKAAAPPKAEAPAETGGDTAEAPKDDRLAALLAKSKAAKERKAAGG